MTQVNRILIFLSIFGFLTYSCQNPKSSESVQEEKNQQTESQTIDQKLPKLIVKEGKNQDLGKIKEGIKTHVTFTLVNIGDTVASDISTHDLSKGGCTSVSSVKKISPGDSAKLTFQFETLGYGGKNPTRGIKVRYNNPKESPFTLKVTAEVLPTKSYQVPIGELHYNFFVLIDVRDHEKFLNEHIVGAINVPSDEVLTWSSKLPKNFLIYLYSDTGRDSDSLAKQLANNGYSSALSMVGGLDEWKRKYGERVLISGPK